MGSSLSLVYLPQEKENQFWNLNLSHCFLRQFPVDFGQKLDAVRKLDLSFNHFNDLDELVVENLNGLKIFDVSHNELSVLPPKLLKFSLEALNISYNPIHSLPKNIDRLDQLAILSVGHCGMRQFPPAISNLTNLRTLIACNNSITKLPESFGELRNLETFDISGNGIQELPSSFGNLSSLNWLNLSNNQLKMLTFSFKNLINLSDLGLGNNALEAFFDLDNFPNLQTLSIFNNKIRSLRYNRIPQKLKTVDAASNYIKYIPESIFFLPNLEYLNLKNNELQTLIGDRISFDPINSNIKFLDLSHNKLLMLPVYLDCRVLNISNNDLIKKSTLILRQIASLETLCINALGLERMIDLGWRFEIHQFTFCDHCKTFFTNSEGCDRFTYYTLEFINMQTIISVPLLSKFCSLSCKYNAHNV